MAKSKAWVMVSKLDKDKTSCALEMYPLVLCEDCQHWVPEEGYCPYNHIYPVPDWFCADGKKKEGEEKMDIREIDGLWCDDITFCPERCGWKDCPRNRVNIRDRTVPHSFSMEIPQDCPKKQES